MAPRSRWRAVLFHSLHPPSPSIITWRFFSAACLHDSRGTVHVPTITSLTSKPASCLDVVLERVAFLSPGHSACAAILAVVDVARTCCLHCSVLLARSCGGSRGHFSQTGSVVTIASTSPGDCVDELPMLVDWLSFFSSSSPMPCNPLM